MRPKVFNLLIFRIFLFLLATCPISAAWLMPACAQTAPDTDTPAANGNLHIRADKLVSQQASNYIQFIGNVEVDVANAKIESSELRVFYQNQSSAGASMTQENLDKVVAIDDVRITMENRTARCDQAVYHPGKQILVLTGESVEIKSENNVVTGSKITYNQKTGEIIVDGDPEQRVNAIIHQIEKRPERKN